MNRIVYAGCFALLLAGCTAPLKTDQKLVALMPESVARKVLESHLGTEWTNAPYIEKTGDCVAGFAPGFMKVERVPIAFTDIKGINYNPTLGKIYIVTARTQTGPFDTCIQKIGFRVSEGEAAEVSNALKSLGACTSADRLQC